jgi:hypothetical protein
VFSLQLLLEVLMAISCSHSCANADGVDSTEASGALSTKMDGSLSLRNAEGSEDRDLVSTNHIQVIVQS